MLKDELHCLKSQYTEKCLDLKRLKDSLKDQHDEGSDQLLTIQTLLELYLTYSAATYKLVFENEGTQGFIPLFRATFESFLNVKYFLWNDGISQKKKAKAYRFCEAKNFLNTTDYLYYSGKDQVTEKLESNLLGESLKKIEEERVTRLVYLEEQRGSSEAVEFKRLGDWQQNKRKISWYTLYTGNSSLKELSKYVGMSEFYQYFYTYLSITSHGVGLFKSESEKVGEIVQLGILRYLDYFMGHVLAGLKV